MDFPVLLFKSTMPTTYSSDVTKASKPVSKKIQLASTFTVTSYSVLIILLLELLFAWAGVGEQEFFEIDPLLGYSLMANKLVSDRIEGYARLRHNSCGMQDVERTIARKANETRIAVLGDSIVQALQVERKNNFCHLLESSLKVRFPEQNFEIMNFGASNYSLGQMYLQLKSKVVEFKPDMVIVAIRPDTSYLLLPAEQGNFLSAKPDFKIIDDGTIRIDRTVQHQWLRSNDAKRMQMTDWLRRHSRIWGVISMLAQSYKSWSQSGGFQQCLNKRVNTEYSFIKSGNPRDTDSLHYSQSEIDHLEKTWTYRMESRDLETESLWHLADAVIGEMKKECDRNNCQFALLRLVSTDGWTNQRESELLAETAKKRGIPLVDTTDRFRNCIRRKAKKLFFVTHLSSEGHKQVALELDKFVGREVNTSKNYAKTNLNDRWSRTRLSSK